MITLHRPTPDATPSAPPPTPARASILLVDDQPARLLTYEAILGGLELDCVRALSGREALKQLLSREFAAILLDVHMPEMDGFETARIIREHPRMERVPIIFVTGVHISEFDRLKGYEAGAIDYIAVPVVPEILRSKVAVLVELHQRRSTLEALNKSLAEARVELEGRHARALAERDVQLNAIFEHPSDPIAVLEAVRDAQGTLIDLRYRDANRQMLSLMIRSRDELLGKTLSEVLASEHASSVIGQCAQVLATRQALRYETHFRHRDFLVTIFPLGDECIVSSSTDITDRKRAEAALRRSEARHRALLDRAPVAVAHNALDGRFEYVNFAFCELVGYSAEELYGRRWQDITHPDDVGLDQRLADQVVAGTLTGYTCEKRYLRKDGSIVWVSLFGNFVADDQGAPVQGVAVVVDITEQRNRQLTLQETSRRKDEFLAMMSHELRNPTAAIGNAAHTLARLVSRPQEQALVEIVERQVRHLGRLLDDLLDVSRLTRGHINCERQLISLRSCLDLAMETTLPLIQERRHRLIVAPATDGPWICADQVRVAQCITNLLNNAAKYSEPGREIHVRLFVEATQAGLEIRDQGIGIDSELLACIFEPFVQGVRTLDRSQGGLGIGLALCRSLLEMQGGSIVAASSGIGQGATFTIRLPLAAAPADSTVTPKIACGTRARVMIVDDNRDAADALELLLALEGHTTLAVYSSEEALKHAPDFDPQFVLLDIGLPQMDGYEVARRLKSLTPQARLIAVTGYGLADDKVRSMQSGFEAHFVKPVRLTDLEAAFLTGAA